MVRGFVCASGVRGFRFVFKIVILLTPARMVVCITQNSLNAKSYFEGSDIVVNFSKF